MKLNVLSVAVAAMFFSAVSQASNTGVIRFTGSVTDTTCNIIPIDDGGTATYDINLGTVLASELTDAAPQSLPVLFSLAPSPGSPPECTDGSKVVEVGFNGSYDAVGLANSAGTAGNTSVKLEGRTSATAWHAYTLTTQNATLQTEADTGALHFRVAMNKSRTGAAASPGTVITQATYSVVYK